MTNRVFICYSEQRAERRALWEALREHGLVPWRDVEDLPLGVDTERDIEGEIAECTSVVIWLTKAIFESPFVRDIEIPAIQRAVAERDILVVPVFDSVDTTDAKDLAVDTWRFPLADYNGHKLDRCQPIEAECAAIAGRLTRIVLKRAATLTSTPIVRAVTRDDSATHVLDCTLNFDWRHAYKDGELPEANIVNRLESALNTSMAHLKEAFETGPVVLALKTHLHVAVALGHSLRRPTGFVPTMEVGDRVWCADDTVSPKDGALVVVETEHLESSEGRATVEISISRDVGPGVDEFIERRAAPYTARISVTPALGPEQTALPDGDSANAWARLVISEMANLSNSNTIEGFDVFPSCPVEFAVMLGWWLNASGSIDLFHWSANTGPYHKAWTLPSV